MGYEELCDLAGPFLQLAPAAIPQHHPSGDISMARRQFEATASLIMKH